jgi:hypothetical protein
MAPASLLDWSEPRQQWRYPKRMTVMAKIHNSQTIKMQSTIDLNEKEADTAYKKICKFLKRLKSKKCESIYNFFFPSLKIYFQKLYVLHLTMQTSNAINKNRTQLLATLLFYFFIDYITKKPTYLEREMFDS